MSDGAPVPPAQPRGLPLPALPGGEASTGRRGRLTLATRTGLLTAGVAALAVMISALIAYPLVRQSSTAQAQSTLARQATVVADLMTGRTSDTEDDLRDTVRSLQTQGISGYVVRERAAPPAPLTADDVEAVTHGGSISDARDTSDGTVFVEGRPLGRDRGLILVQPARVATAATGELLERMLLALVAGLLMAALVGWLASRQVTRSLRDAASAAERLSTGERDVRLRPDGPAEVAEIADSLNRLSAALAVSENRQRAFFVSVSHELRTPLTTVKGYGEALRDEVVDPADVPRTGGIVVAEADRLERLVSDLLDLARAGAVDFRVDLCEVDLAELMADAGEVWRDRCERDGVLFHLEVPDQPVPITTDPVRLRQIVDNLAENALRVTPAGAPIVLAARGLGNDAVVEVRDGGPGLTEADLPAAFVPEELYSRYRGVRSVGTGVGLALVGSLATRLGGSAEAGHAPEGGARFTVTIPRVGP